MKISTILDHIDSGHMALPEFQRGYVWNRDQVRSLFQSLYHRNPVGGLLVWITESVSASRRGDERFVPGVVKLLLDGQQRITSIYGVIRGKPPRFFDGNSQAFSGLYFHLETETFEFYHPIKMGNDPLWVNVSEQMKKGMESSGELFESLKDKTEFRKYVARLNKLLQITEIEIHNEEVTGADKTLDIVVDIFNRVNSGGTKLSKGDLALAKICSGWPEGREIMKGQLKKWKDSGYDFNLDWLLRSVNTVLTGEAKFLYLHNKDTSEIQQALTQATDHIENILNMIEGRLGLDHDRVFFGRFAVPVMARYLEQRRRNNLAQMDEKERDKLLFWYVQAAMWGRFSGSTESFIDKDLELLEEQGGGLDKLLEELKLWRGGGLRAEPGNFTGWSLGARFYPVLYLLTRMGDAKDWGMGLPLKFNLRGKKSRLEVHHIFPKAQLYRRQFKRPEVNALANFCFLTQNTNLDISDRLPEEYFLVVEEKHPGALASQWIPMDKNLWKVENYRDFLEARKKLLADELNQRMREMLHGDTQWMEGAVKSIVPEEVFSDSVADEDEEKQLEQLNQWIVKQGLPQGELSWSYSDEGTGEEKAIFDLAWPNGIQEELTQPVAVLLNEDAKTVFLANSAGFKCFTSIQDFELYIRTDVLREDNGTNEIDQTIDKRSSENVIPNI